MDGLFGLFIVRPLICAGVMFVISSAMFAWSGQPFELHWTIAFAAAFGFVIAVLPFVESSTRRKRFALLRRKVAVRRNWRECEEEVERLRSSKNER